MSSGELRVVLLLIGLAALALIYFFGRPRKPGQGKRLFGRAPGERVEPTLGTQGLDDIGATRSAEQLGLGEHAQTGTAQAQRVMPGVRPQQDYDRIVTLYVAAHDGETIAGAELIVAAEKAGLTYGDMGIYHRMLDGKPELGPLFSVANMLKPGSFDLPRIDALRTPGITLFLTLPGPLPALDAWDAMLPAAQRMAELLDAAVLDEERNALGRQRIAHIREELRAYDRKQEQSQIKPKR